MADPQAMQKAALDMMIASRAQEPPHAVGIGGHDLLHAAAEALVTCAHLIAAAAKFDEPQVLAAVGALSDAGKEKNLSLDELLEARRQLG